MNDDVGGRRQESKLTLPRSENSTSAKSDSELNGSNVGFQTRVQSDGRVGGILGECQMNIKRTQLRSVEST